MKIKFTPDIQSVLKALEMRLTHYPAVWEDVGGPELEGHEAYDEWSNNEFSVYVVRGHIRHIEKIPPVFPDVPF